MSESELISKRQSIGLTPPNRENTTNFKTGAYSALSINACLNIVLDQGYMRIKENGGVEMGESKRDIENAKLIDELKAKIELLESKLNI